MLICNFTRRTCFAIFAIDYNQAVLNSKLKLVWIIFALFSNFDTPTLTNKIENRKAHYKKVSEKLNSASIAGSGRLLL